MASTLVYSLFFFGDISEVDNCVGDFSSEAGVIIRKGFKSKEAEGVTARTACMMRPIRVRDGGQGCG